ncbi:glucose-6-phosphate dehydrogenase [Buchnera aphidicola str. APS (Acyrthosiphon pisum)]|uniref:Glucose-6-phosphate 1-dehydrogenase n=1 Tax=Buchnera aphidicola subsp. Acyrthosiphon pisum (strain 5A) TaxID=563178 RepID=A0A7U4DIE2_BUCA5|nr:glucose-6-phosphate dehydrogenase [Buchnera aphidicola]ACL30681.1 glucose-6-phosphate 1-dehydrogenase [Buchnera aphidicola str. 5A (Acyrthosiphon pisum)]ADP66712.1 glucose-6-phosphate 1-dehydrogenase [Buchnera aphidicola str. TLW03 (Acyrthosiphon pisum)]ADP67294.1 glucose-6-phosphate 1-dehydrogenase [Buchnera aphidicola str. JF99 (Acyrthosiphon pisum)]OQX98290.1 MAG: glucose-6-phosphate dehydrogenase [Erwiniaceae bacterium 4572_131]
MIIETNHACDLVIFGAKGDLTKRKLLPALYKLEKSKKIHKYTRIIASGRADWSTEDYIEKIKTEVKNFLNEEINDLIWKNLSSRIFFCNIDVHEPLHFFRLKTILKQKKNIIVYYCAVPPNTLNSIFIGLGNAHLNSVPSRIVLEKPLGVCLKTSKKINDQISKYFLESQIFRIDHYLGKESILNLFALRFSNTCLFYNWNNKTIDHIQITVSEEVGIEDRWNYFNMMGQMKDMVQNHLLQILTILTMDQPKNISSESIQHEKVKILRSLNPINIHNINKKTVRGQYCSGVINEKKVPSYLEENGANKNSLTETFVAIKVDLNNKQWSGVPFYLRTGKRLAHKYSEIVVFFKKKPTNLFKNLNSELLQNKLIIRLEPNPNIIFDFSVKAPGLEQEYKIENSQLKSSQFSKKYSKNSIDAYERLLFEIMRGVQSLFVCRDEIEAAWKWIDPIIHAWKNSKNNAPQLYMSGTWGPKNSDLLLAHDGRVWYEFH